MRLDTQEQCAEEMNEEFRGAALAFCKLVGHINRGGLIARHADESGWSELKNQIPALVQLVLPHFGPVLDAMLKQLTDTKLITPEEGRRALFGGEI